LGRPGRLDDRANFRRLQRRGGTLRGSAAGQDDAGEGKLPQHPLKFPKGDLFDRLERCRKASTVKLPRNTWILQAMSRYRLDFLGHPAPFAA
jgi:hypothetical protein